jgi:hypothetical protein
VNSLSRLVDVLADDVVGDHALEPILLNTAIIFCHKFLPEFSGRICCRFFGLLNFKSGFLPIFFDYIKFRTKFLPKLIKNWHLVVAVQVTVEQRVADELHDLEEDQEQDVHLHRQGLRQWHHAVVEKVHFL